MYILCHFYKNANLLHSSIVIYKDAINNTKIIAILASIELKTWNRNTTNIQAAQQNNATTSHYGPKFDASC